MADLPPQSPGCEYCAEPHAAPSGSDKPSRVNLEVSVNVGEQDSSFGSRLPILSIPVLFEQQNRYVLQPPFIQPPLPAFEIPVAGDGRPFTENVEAATPDDGVKATGRTRTRGLTGSLTYAFQNLDSAGWQFRLSGRYDETAARYSADRAVNAAYRFEEEPTLFRFCDIFIVMYCSNYQSLRGTRAAIGLPAGTTATGNVTDRIRHDLSDTEFDADLSWRQPFTAAGHPLYSQLGVRVGGGYWDGHVNETVNWIDPSENGFMVSERHMSGPTASLQITGGIGGQATHRLHWKISGAYGIKTTRLKYDAITSTSASDVAFSTARKHDGGEIGEIGLRLDHVRGPWRTFMEARRRWNLGIGDDVRQADAASTIQSDIRSMVSPVTATQFSVGTAYRF